MKIKEAIEVLKQMNPNDEVSLDFKLKSINEMRDAYGRTLEGRQNLRGKFS